MKTRLFLRYFVIISALAFAGCSTNRTIGTRDKTPGFANAAMYYFYDDFVPGVGSFGIALYNGDPKGTFTELYIDFASDYFKDALRAIPAEGVYTFSDDYSRFTFNNAYSSYIEKKGDKEIMFGLVGGKFSLSRNASGYLLQYDIELGDGSSIKGRYDGKILGKYDSNIVSDLHFNLETMNFDGAEAVRVNGNMWAVLLWGEYLSGPIETGKVEILLMINAANGAPSLPDGHFPMAGKVGEGVEGTAEPASAYNRDIDGSHFIHSGGNVAWSVPGKGFIEIAETGGSHTINFSFEDPNGHTVSGAYTGKIDQYGTHAQITFPVSDWPHEHPSSI